MEKWQHQTECAEMDAIERLIADTALPKHSLSDQIMSKIEARPLSRRLSRAKPNVMKRVAVATSAAAILGVGVIGAGFVSPVMAATLKQIPVIGVLFQGTSEEAVRAAIKQGIVSTPNLSVTHDGITLKLTNLLYDGTRLSFLVEREGENLPFNAGTPYIPFDPTEKGEWAKKRMVPEKDQLKGYIKRPTILANGKEIDSASGQYGDYPLGKSTAYEVELFQIKHLPDEFELTVQLNVTKVKETFEFKIPVKVKNKALVLKPGMSKSHGDFSYTVKQLDISLVSTRLILDSKGPVPRSPAQTGKYHASKMYYELVDDKGIEVELSQYGYFHGKPKTKYNVDELYSPFKGVPKSITIKPYTLTVKNKDWNVVGRDLKNDKKGDRTYIKQLEMTIPVKK
ncbi:DUF4179 domain-containing protein [Paenibacillus sp. 481]|uniref:DUF4179 domain-containing protein n=1 Tax=Paenibacillus sp. 481 TaxID=2835869 RepID=UPI001E47627F|nr:DUF4179 domain-containing protein [Paenibacillus sp. 481]UHA73496.1 DUF4179 domain-containing protein [Paenibacillus sp. 481]